MSESSILDFHLVKRVVVISVEETVLVILVLRTGLILQAVNVRLQTVISIKQKNSILFIIVFPSQCL